MTPNRGNDGFAVRRQVGKKRLRAQQVHADHTAVSFGLGPKYINSTQRCSLMKSRPKTSAKRLCSTKLE